MKDNPWSELLLLKSGKSTLEGFKREQSLEDWSHVAWVAKILETCKAGTEDWFEGSTIFGSKREVVFEIEFELLSSQIEHRWEREIYINRGVDPHEFSDAFFGFAKYLYIDAKCGEVGC